MADRPALLFYCQHALGLGHLVRSLSVAEALVDPFAGVGTLGLAARSLGLEYLGAELVPEWHAEAERALASEQIAWAW